MIATKLYHHYDKQLKHDKKTDKYKRLRLFLGKDPHDIITENIDNKIKINAGYARNTGSADNLGKQFAKHNASMNIYSVLYHRNFSVLWKVLDEIGNKCAPKNCLDVPKSLVIRFLYGDNFRVKTNYHDQYDFVPQKIYDTNLPICDRVPINKRVIWVKNNNLAARGDFVSGIINLSGNELCLWQKLISLRQELGMVATMNTHILCEKGKLNSLEKERSNKYKNKLCYYDTSKTIGLEFQREQILGHEIIDEFLISENNISQVVANLYDMYRRKSLILSRVSALRRLELIYKDTIKKIGTDYFVDSFGSNGLDVFSVNFMTRNKFNRNFEQIIVISIYLHKIKKLKCFPELFCDDCDNFEQESMDLCVHIRDHVNSYALKFPDPMERARKINLLNKDMQYFVVKYFVNCIPNHEQQKYILDSKFYKKHWCIYCEKFDEIVKRQNENNSILIALKEKYKAPSEEYIEHKRLRNIEKRKRKKLANK